MERYNARFDSGPLCQRIREIALEAERLLKSSHALSVHGADIVRGYEARADALHKAADILKSLEGEYDEPYPET